MESPSRFNKDAKEQMKALGMDPSSETYKKKILEGAASHGESAVETAKNDLKIAKEWSEKTTFTNEEMLDSYNKILRTFVVKLNNGNVKG